MNRNSQTSRPTVEERPLSPLPALALALAATAAILAFYLYCLVILLVIATLLLLDLVLLIALLRFHLAALIAPSIGAQIGLAIRVIKSLVLQGGPEFRLDLRRDQAPQLFQFVEEIALQTHTTAPQNVCLVMDANAHVQLRGYGKGRGHTTLGLGFDLLAGLTISEMTFVIAHEMAHARLVQRGFQNWLHKALGRMSQLGMGLHLVVIEAQAEERRFLTAKVLAFGVDVLGKSSSRLVAALSRQDEFTADRQAALISGPAACRDALLEISIINARSSDITWHERLVSLQREESFTSWLRSRLTVAEGERQEMVATALKEGWRDPWSTHPELSDRLAAIESVAVPALPQPIANDGNPALDLLQNADSLAGELLDAIAQVSKEEERRETALRRKEVRLSDTPNKRTAGSWVALVLAVFGGMGLVIAMLLWLEGSTSFPAKVVMTIVFAGILGLGLHINRATMWREAELLPIPAFAAWRQALLHGERPQRDSWSLDLTAQLRSELTPPQDGRAAADFWAARCYEELGSCNYLRAYAAAGLSYNAAPPYKPLGALTGRIVAGSFIGDGLVIQQALEQAVTDYGHVDSVRWAMAWALVNLGNWDEAEAYLLDTIARRPGIATSHSLLALCQRQRGKFGEAEDNARQAVALEPNEAQHRLLLTTILLGAGRVRESLRELQWLHTELPNDPEVLHVAVQAHLLMGQRDVADQRAARLLELAPTAETYADLGEAYAEAKDVQTAQDYFQRATESTFSPKSLAGLAAIAQEQKDSALARRLYLQAVDLTRERAPMEPEPLESLATALSGLRAMDEDVLCERAWWARIDVSRYNIEAERLGLLIAAPDRTQAEKYVTELCRALDPARDDIAGWIQWEEYKERKAGDEPLYFGISSVEVE